METLKNSYRYLVFLLLIGGLAACSSTGNLPADDVYYSSKANNPAQYNYADYKKSAQNHSGNTVDKGTHVGEYDTDYSQGIGSGMVAENAMGTKDSSEYEFIDEYYDSDYASRISRFNGNGNSNDYYDESYTSGGCCSSPNVSLSFGVGMGYGWGMGYNYGWPYYSWGYPYYPYPYYRWGYPYYGSYWAGYNNGYWNGYNDGYYNGGGGYYPGGYYPGGYYPEYGYTATYSPRGRGAGGSSIPRSGGRSGTISKSGSRMISEDENLLARGGNAVSPTINKQSATKASEDSRMVNPKSRTESLKGTPDDARMQSESTRLRKPVLDDRSSSSKPADRYQKQPQKRGTQQGATPRYEKPKSYESLPSRQPRTSKEYVRQAKPSSKMNSKESENTFNRSIEQNNSRNNYSAPRSSSSPRNSDVKTRTNSSPKSYRSPETKSNSSKSYSSPSKSYSSPSRSTSSGSGGRSSSSGGRSSSSPTRTGGGKR